ncbi:MAG: alpha-amylase [Spirochaetaceae bacterium]|nr:MAG: alpha-amylase [Spirochaetaceae bacterium]
MCITKHKIHNKSRSVREHTSHAPCGVFESAKKLAQSRSFCLQWAMNTRIHELVRQIYPLEQAAECTRLLEAVLTRMGPRLQGPAQPLPTDRLPLDESDSIVITYGDQFFGGEGAPLEYLLRFLSEELEGHATGVHILPFSPYSSDDGFSVIDYRSINPALGEWRHVRAVGAQFRLMADLVLNHCSSHSEWFAAFLRDEEPFRRYFITAAPGTDTSSVVRPRALPLLTPFETPTGEKLVWTTFSSDQVDLNFAEPEVLVEMFDILLSYVEQGAQMIRLDAIAYLWKELGTSCLNHPNTHRVVQLYRAVLEDVAPWVVLVTDTNVPHDENVSYFGDGSNEAQLVYNFALPPLTLDAVIREDTGHLQRWAASLPQPSGATGFLNFLASHDGIGLLPTHGILSDAERDALIQTVRDRGGRISYKSSKAGDIPFEMNVNYLSAVADPNLPETQRAKIFLASQSIMLCLAGVPGMYIQSLLGSTNWAEGVEQTGMNRSINRQKLEYDSLVADLAQPGSLRHLVFEGFKRLLRARASDTAFDPGAAQRVLPSERELFVVVRKNARTDSTVLCLQNLSSRIVETTIPPDVVSGADERSFVDLISGDRFYPYWTSDGRVEIGLEPYEVMWLKVQ